MTALTREQQEQGQRQLLLASVFNPLGGSIIMGPLIGLLALYYGASDFAMGLIYAGVHLTSISAVLPLIFFKRYDFTRIMGYAWLWRALIGGAMLLLPLLLSNDNKVVLLVLLLYGFLLCRSIGATTALPIFKALNRAGELTSFTASIFSLWYLGLLATTVVSYVVLENKDLFPSEEMAYMSLLAMAFMFNVLTALMYLRLPPCGRPSGHGLVSLARAAQFIRRQPAYRDVMVVGLLQTALAVAAGYQLSHIKGPLDFSAGSVFALTLVGFIGAYAMARLIRLLGDSISFRSLLFFTHFLLAVCGICWLSMEYYTPELQQWLASVIYVLSTAMLAMSATVYGAMRSAQLPDHLRLEVSTMYLLNMTVAAGASLGVIALLRWLLYDVLDNPYGFVYVAWTALSIGICIWAVIRRGNNDPHILSELRRLRPANIQSIHAMQRLNNTESRHGHHRVREIENALHGDTPASREHQLKFLQSTHFTERLAACYSLLDRPYEEANPLLWREALDISSPIRGEAITALGFCGDPAYCDKLETLLDDDDPNTVSHALKSLLRLNAAVSDERVMQVYRQLPGNRYRLQLIIGLSENRRSEALAGLLQEEGLAGADARWLITLALQWADSIDRQPRLATLLELEQESVGSGINDLLHEAAAVSPEWQDRLLLWQQVESLEQFSRASELQCLWPLRHEVDLLLQLNVLLWQTHPEFSDSRST